jgi:hypothetical protein
MRTNPQNPHPLFYEHPHLCRNKAGEGQTRSARKGQQVRAVRRKPARFSCTLNDSVGAQLFYLVIAVPQLTENFAGMLAQQRRGLHLHWTVR